MWSVANEPDSEAAAAATYFKHLVAQTKALDPSRPVTFASFKSPEKDVAAAHVDLIMINKYHAWYTSTGQLDIIPPLTKRDVLAWRRIFKKPIMISEYAPDLPRSPRHTRTHKMSTPYTRHATTAATPCTRHATTAATPCTRHATTAATHTHTRRATTAATHKHTRRATTAAIHTHTRRATSSRARPTPHAYVRYGADAVAGVHAHPSVAFSEEFQSDYLTAHYPPFDELRKSYAPRDLEVPPFSPPVTRSRHSRP